ncbi:hypothetical protein [Corynebacterium striatum]|nr:hypothetical protein [Corynebacterium striatum]MDK8827113.1 hypothetical protein [Corynebacterium striatum]
MNIRTLQAMVDETDLAMKSEERKESTFSQNHCGAKEISTITWSYCGN